MAGTDRNKSRLDKLGIGDAAIELAAEEDGFEFLAIGRSHARRAATMPWDHRDPWDRLIAAQAMEEGYPLISTDSVFDGAGVERIWGGQGDTMDLEALKATLRRDAPPDGLSLALQALWHQAKGNWDRAHELAQAQPDADGAWVHAYLHRVEGDEGNAGYWYRNAGRPPSQARLDIEWEEIAAALLKAGG